HELVFHYILATDQGELGVEGKLCASGQLCTVELLVFTNFLRVHFCWEKVCYVNCLFTLIYEIDDLNF
ncbi:MAG: hypothetical protein KAI99_06530, partial [Cyclobacteriaceae bacterium]|nr:hypothetical protein [Cyclobacteriaceae bacterium]